MGGQKSLACSGIGGIPPSNYLNYPQVYLQLRACILYAGLYTSVSFFSREHTVVNSWFMYSCTSKTLLKAKSYKNLKFVLLHMIRSCRSKEKSDAPILYLHLHMSFQCNIRF